MNETTGTGKKLASTVAGVNQIIGQTIPPATVDAPRTSRQFFEDIKLSGETDDDLDRFTIPGVGSIPNIFKTRVGDQSSLPQSPNINPNLFARAPTGIMTQATGPMNQGLTPTEQALLSPEEQAIRLRSRGLA